MSKLKPTSFSSMFLLALILEPLLPFLLWLDFKTTFHCSNQVRRLPSSCLPKRSYLHTQIFPRILWLLVRQGKKFNKSGHQGYIALLQLHVRRNNQLLSPEKPEKKIVMIENFDNFSNLEQTKLLRISFRLTKICFKILICNMCLLMN